MIIIAITKTTLIFTNKENCKGIRKEEHYKMKECETVTEAVEFMKNEGALYPSSTEFCIGMWYESQHVTDFRTGNESVLSFHIYASLNDETDIFNKFTGKVRDIPKIYPENQEASDFEKWWRNEGCCIAQFPHHIIEEHIKHIANIAWRNGVYKCEEYIKNKE